MSLVKMEHVSVEYGAHRVLNDVSLEIEPGEAQARVIVNSRTGTVVIGANVRVTPAAVSHGSLVVTIRERPFVSQPQAPFSAAGQPVALPDSDVRIAQEDASMFLFEPGTSLDEIVQAVNKVGAAPGDLVAILEALKQAGALRAELSSLPLEHGACIVVQSANKPRFDLWCNAG